MKIKFNLLDNNARTIINIDYIFDICYFNLYYYFGAFMPKKSDESFLKLVKALPDIVYKIDENGFFTYINESVNELGFKPDELLGQHFTTIIHPIDVESVHSLHVLKDIKGKDIGDQNSPKLFDERRTGCRITKGLKLRLIPKKYIDIKSYPDQIVKSMFLATEVFSLGLYDSEGDDRIFTGTLGIIRNISEREKSAESQLRLEKYYRTLIENASDLIFILSNDGTILFVSPSISRILDYEELDMLGENIFDFIPDNQAKTIDEFLTNNDNNNEECESFEYCINKKNGSVKTLEAHCTKIFDNEDNLVCIILNSSDITEYKEVVTKLKSNTDELEKKVQERTVDLEKTNELLKISLKEKEILLKEIHHRVKNNLQIISSLLNLQSSSIPDENIQDIFNDCRNRVNSMSLIHENLYQSPDLNNIDFDKYVKNLADSLQSSYSTKNAIALNIDIHDVFLNINTAVPCGLIINELVSNSFKHGFPKGKKGKINIKFHPENDNLLLIIKDNGIGIPEKSLKDKSSFGLNLIEMLTEQINGTLEIKSKKGTEVIVRFQA